MSFQLPPHAPAPSPGGGGSIDNSGPKRAKYSSRVCAECARKHCKCNGVQPQCAPCATAMLECVWPEKKATNLRDRVGKLEATNDRLQSTIETLQAKVETLQATIERLQSTVDAGAAVGGPQAQLTALAVPLTPGSPGPPSSFLSSTESSPHPGPHSLDPGANLGVPPFQYPYARRHAHTMSGVSSASEISFEYGGRGSTHLGVPRRHARTLSGSSSFSDGSSQYEPYGSSRSSSPIGPVPALFVERAPMRTPSWPEHAGFNGLGVPRALGYPIVPVENVGETGSGRSDDQVTFNGWGHGSGAGSAALGLQLAENSWENVSEDMVMDS